LAAEAGDIRIRPARDTDAEGLIRLIGECYADYPGCVMDLKSYDTDLLSIDTEYRGKGGRFHVAEDADGHIVGCIGWTPDGSDRVELKRLYVNKAVRRRGLASRLYRIVLNAARGQGAGEIDLWSDTRFHEAHAFYQALGFEQLPETRDLHDASNSTEYHFRLKLTGRG